MQQPGASRLKNVARNASVGVVAQILIFSAGLGYRTVFIHYLAVEYLGAQALFGDVLNLLSLAEFGIASAILFSMYEPMARGDNARAAALLLLYKRLYRVVAVVVLIVGLALVPFLDHVVKDGASVSNLRLIFVLMLLDVVAGYLSAYRKTLFVADQQEFRVTASTTVFTLARYAAQTLVLVLWGSFILTLVLKIIGNLATNLYLSWLAGRVYPEVVKSPPSRLEKSFLREHFAKMRALMLHKISGLVVSATDSILIGRFFGLAPAGVYSNYLLIIGMAMAFLQQVSNATTASVGHLTALDSVERAKRIFLVLEFAYQWAYCLATLMLLTLFNPVLTLWLGDDFVFSQPIVMAICASFYVLGRGAGVQAFRNARGLYEQDKWRGPVEAVVNLVLSLVLLRHLGIGGVFLGTFLAHLLLSVWIEPYVVYRWYFRGSPVPYLAGRAKEMFEIVLLAVPLLVLQRELAGRGALGVIAIACSTLLVVNLYLWVRYRRTWQYRHLAEIVGGRLRTHRK